MRVIFPLMLIVFGILLVGFIVTNPDQPVSVTLAGQTYATSLLLVETSPANEGAYSSRSEFPMDEYWLLLLPPAASTNAS